MGREIPSRQANVRRRDLQAATNPNKSVALRRQSGWELAVKAVIHEPQGALQFLPLCRFRATNPPVLPVSGNVFTSKYFFSRPGGQGGALFRERSELKILIFDDFS